MTLRNASTRALLLGALLGCTGSVIAAPGAGPAPATPKAFLRVQIDNDAPLKLNAPVYAHTLEPLYLGSAAVIPANSKVEGSIVSLKPVSKSSRFSAYSHGDFTPLHVADLHFDRATTPDGRVIPLKTLNAELASTTVRLESKTVKRSAFHRLWGNAKDRAHGFIRNFTAPGRGTRAREYVYSQLPYHPQSLISRTQYDVPLLALPEPPQNTSQTAPNQQSRAVTLPNRAITIHSRLVAELDSKNAKQGDKVVAEVTQPVFDGAGHVTVPVGSLIRGSVLRAEHARRLGRSGALRFTFTELVLPSGKQEHVTGVPHAIYAQPGYPQRLDEEGGVEPQSKTSALFPLMLGALATRSLQADESRRAHAAVSSNGLGLITRIIAVSSGSNLAGGVIGGIDTARAVYSRFIGRGQEVDFPAHTPIEIELSRTEAPVLMGDTTAARTEK